MPTGVYLASFIPLRNDTQFNLPLLEWLILFENLMVSLVVSLLHSLHPNFKSDLHFYFHFLRDLHFWCIYWEGLLKSCFFFIIFNVFALPSTFSAIIYHDFTYNNVLLFYQGTNMGSFVRNLLVVDYINLF